jgi:hypothetical protein
MNEEDLSIFLEYEDSLEEYANIFDLFKFIESKNPKYKIPFKAKLLFSPNITDEDLIIKGDTDLTDINMGVLPDGLKIQGDLDLTSTDIESLPSGLKVDGALDLKYTSISELPKDLKVGRWLDITGTPLAEKYFEKYKSNIFGSQKNKIKKAFKKDYPNLLGEEGYLIISNWDGD